MDKGAVQPSILSQNSGDSNYIEDGNDEEEVELRVVIGIPAYNSERDLPRTVKPLRGIVDEIIVCDNASTDSTSKVAKELGCRVVLLPRHSTNSSALLWLFRAALESKADVLLTIAPGTWARSSDIENLATLIAQKRSDIVVGTNQSTGKVDMEESPIKAYSKDALSRIISSESPTLGAALNLGLRISKNPVSSARSKGAGVMQQQAESQGTTRSVSVAVAPSKVRLTNFLFRNISFWRAILLACGIVVSGLLLTYSVIFYYKIQTLGATTSVFPWFYYVYYTNTNAALVAFLSGLVPALSGLVMCTVLLFRWVLPNLRYSIEPFRKTTKKISM
jgi:glycosyltransferase involved in cell wall biosynthesis